MNFVFVNTQQATYKFLGAFQVECPKRLNCAKKYAKNAKKGKNVLKSQNLENVCAKMLNPKKRAKMC